VNRSQDGFPSKLYTHLNLAIGTS